MGLSTVVYLLASSPIWFCWGTACPTKDGSLLKSTSGEPGKSALRTGDSENFLAGRPRFVCMVCLSRRLEEGLGTSVATLGVDVEWCLLLPCPHACAAAQGNTGVVDEVATPTLAAVALPLILFLFTDLEDCKLHSHSVKKTASSCTRGELPEKWACPKLVVWAWPHSPSNIATPLKAVWVLHWFFSFFLPAPLTLMNHDWLNLRLISVRLTMFAVTTAETKAADFAETAGQLLLLS